MLHLKVPHAGQAETGTSHPPLISTHFSVHILWYSIFLTLSLSPDTRNTTFLVLASFSWSKCTFHHYPAIKGPTCIVNRCVNCMDGTALYHQHTMSCCYWTVVNLGCDWYKWWIEVVQALLQAVFWMIQVRYRRMSHLHRQIECVSKDNMQAIWGSVGEHHNFGVFAAKAL